VLQHQDHQPKEHMEGDVERLEVQMEEDEDDSRRQSGVETSGLSTMIDWERQGVGEVRQDHQRSQDAQVGEGKKFIPL